MIVASLVESEANRDEDRGKVARVIYNRLETDATNGLLQIDATVNYALGRDLGLGLTSEDLQVDSPYNTRRYPGPPARPDRVARVTPRSRRPRTRPRATGSTTSRSTSTPARRSSPTTTTSSCATSSELEDVVRRPRTAAER